MKVRHNTASVNTLRRFGMNQTELQKDLEKLSSGYKINKAGDDAAGLAVSESMRERIKGLDQGHNNINDGMSLINVAEGGMEEITDMLQRMSKLAHQAVNDTYNEDNRKEIQLEINELKNEIVRIADSTEFNEIHVLRLKKESRMQTFTKTGFPDWLTTKGSNSTDMTKGNIPFGQQPDPDDPDDVQPMLKLKTKDVNGNPIDPINPVSKKFIYEYYGPEDSMPDGNDYMEIVYGGEWSTELDNNLGAVISFKGLADKYNPADTTGVYSQNEEPTASGLYRDVYELLGTSLGVSCATCNEPGVIDPHYYGFAFYGTAKDPDSGKTMTYFKDGMMYTEQDGSKTSVTGNAIDVSKITIPKENGMPLFDFLSWQVKQNPTGDELAKIATDVAQRIFEETYDGLKKYIKSEDHFNRACKDETNAPMTMGIYDYRDVDITEAGSVTVSLKGNTTGYCVEHPDPIWIQCSSIADDRVPLKLPFVDIGDLGVESFDVSKYGNVLKTVYNPEDLERERRERLDPKNTKTSTTHVEGQTITVTMPDQDIPIFKTMPNDKGENVRMQVGTQHVQGQTRTTTIPPQDITTTEYTGFKATGHTEEVREYIRPDIDVVTKAIDKISSFRAILGAQYNRLEHSRNNNEVMDENIISAESRIRDTNMAGEMSKFQKDSMLMNVTERMLGTADESTRGILDLLG